MLSGCSSMDRINQTMKQTDTDYSTATGHINQMASRSPVQDLTTQWINPVPLNSQVQQAKLPGCTPIFNRPGEVSLAEVSAFITRTCKISVVITPDAQAVMMPGQGKTERIQGSIPAPDSNGMVPLNAMGAVAPVAREVGRASNTLRGVHWEGSLDGLLDNVTTRLGLSWRYEQGRIAIFYLDTRSFPIDFQDSKTEFTSKSVYGTSSSTGGNGVSGDGNTSQTTTTEMNTNRYKELETAVKAMLTPETGRLSLSSGMLTVTDTPRVLNSVQRYIEGRNKELTRQVSLSVRVYSVTKKQQDQMGIDWDAVLRTGSLGLSLGNTMSGTSSSAMTGGISILDGRFANSNAFVHALAHQANVSVVTKNDSTTTNMSPVRIQVVTQQDYLSQISTTDTANVGSSTSVEKSTISTGFNMTMLPYIRPGSDQIELQFSISMSDDPDMQAEKVGDVTLKLPKTKMQNFAQNVILQSGQALLLSGYQQANNHASKQGVGSSSFFGLGGGANGEKGDTILVMLITPTLF
ncbi:PilN family type IVB pilus formation outer membrane protein [Yersinia kristensenii]|nr:PilN family type IVB pilus formation outer membrane protein [Yersinia kristensenii]